VLVEGDRDVAAVETLAARLAHGVANYGRILGRVHPPQRVLVADRT
jgi:hypothetical protein